MTSFIDRLWDEDILPTLSDYITIPNKSPMFDPEWQAHGHMAKAVSLFEAWAKKHLAKVAGATVEVVEPDGRTPLIFIEIPGTAPGTMLLCGQLDRQPEM